MRVIRRIGNWLDERLQLGTPIRGNDGPSDPRANRELVLRVPASAAK